MNPRSLLARLSARPFDWRGGRDSAPEVARPPVDVVVPVYGAAAELAACLRSVVAHTDWQRHRLVVVLDGVPQPAPEQAIEAEAHHVPRLILSNPVRRGFVASVNVGMAAGPDRDVVLLNSDTVVTERWLEKLQDAAGSAREIATVTPFCNDATICSLPRWLERNDLPAGYDLAAFARLVERSSARSYPRLPTGVGVCLYVKRRALQAVGAFDEAGFGLGYGEENDFCVRAIRAGFVHVLDDATFILHAGHRSFGKSSTSLMRSAARVLRRRHPDYFPSVAAFLREDPLAPARARVVQALQPRARGRTPPARILHLVHGWPPEAHGGTEGYARTLALDQASRREVMVYARSADDGARQGESRERIDGGVRVRLRVNNFRQRDPLSRNALFDAGLERDFERVLDEFAPDLLHVHHLAGHAASLPQIASGRGIPIVYQVQDWWTTCARVNLLLPDRELCSGPGIDKCARCQPLTRIHPRPLWNRLLHGYRQRVLRRALHAADALVMGSRFIEASFRELGLIRLRQRVHVIRYGVDVTLERTPEPPPAPLRFGCIGSLLPHKGAHVAVAAFAGIDPAQATLAIWGDPRISPAYADELTRLATPAVRFEGNFAEADKARLLSALHVLIVPSLGLESFGLAAHEAMACGVPVLASRRGALVEIFEASTAGALFEPGNAAELRAWVERGIAEPELVQNWRSGLPPVKTAAEHAGEIEAVYAEILAARARA